MAVAKDVNSSNRITTNTREKQKKEEEEKEEEDAFLYINLIV